MLRSKPNVSVPVSELVNLDLINRVHEVDLTIERIYKADTATESLSLTCTRQVLRGFDGHMQV